MEKNFIGLGHICIYVKNIEASIDFYTKLLFFKKKFSTTIKKGEKNEANYAVVALGQCVVELLQPKNQENVSDKAGVIEHYSIEVKNIEKVAEYLAKNQVNMLTDVFEISDFDPSCKGCFIQGPSGELIELFEYGEGPFYKSLFLT